MTDALTAAHATASEARRRSNFLAAIGDPPWLLPAWGKQDRLVTTVWPPRTMNATRSTIFWNFSSRLSGLVATAFAHAPTICRNTARESLDRARLVALPRAYRSCRSAPQLAGLDEVEQF